ncbi:3-phenylpropionate/trans-cinnamate dioxygenase ferredoxin reductase subunit [Nitrobacteraceae bacterium AZCC 2161]
MSDRVVIAGAGLAGCQVAIALREKGFPGTIVLVGAEQEPPYQRPPLSKAFLKGESSMADIQIRSEAFFAEKRIDVILNACATSIDRRGHGLAVGGRAPIHYDRLILATGARNRRLGVQGEELQGVVSLRTAEDAKRLRPALVEGRKLVIVGAGFVGMEVGAVAAGLGAEVTIVESSDQALRRAVSRPIADYLVARHKKENVRFEFGASVEAIDGDATHRVRQVRLADGRMLSADIVLVAVGVAPSVELAETAGLATENGILVDSYLRTSDPRIFAIGDCANVAHGLYGGRRIRLESVQNANDQARCVAATLVGTDTAYDSVPWFWSDQWDVKLQIAGLSAIDHDHVVRGDPRSGRFSVARIEGGALTAIESVNFVSEHMTARNLLKSRTAVDPEKLADAGFPLRQCGTAGDRSLPGGASANFK